MYCKLYVSQKVTMVKWQLLHYISATNNSLKWIISVYVWSICYFTFSRLWLSPFLSNLQRLESTTVKLPKHLASPCPWGSLFLAQHWLLWWVFQRPVGMSQMSTMLESLKWSPCQSTFLWFCSPHEHLPLSACQLWRGHTQPSLLIRFHASSLLSCYNVS